MKSYSQIIDEEHAKAIAARKPPGTITDVTHRFVGGHVVILRKPKQKAVKKKSST